jgi:hypothetical protein
MQNYKNINDYVLSELGENYYTDDNNIVSKTDDKTEFYFLGIQNNKNQLAIFSNDDVLIEIINVDFNNNIIDNVPTNIVKIIDTYFEDDNDYINLFDSNEIDYTDNLIEKINIDITNNVDYFNYFLTNKITLYGFKYCDWYLFRLYEYK